MALFFKFSTSFAGTYKPLCIASSSYSKQILRLCKTQSSLKLDKILKKDPDVEKPRDFTLEKTLDLNINTKKNYVDLENASHTLKNWSLQVSSGSLKDLEQFRSQKEFINVCKHIEESIPKLSALNLVFILRNLMVLGEDPHSYLVQNIETEILWKSRRLNLGGLLSLLELHHGYQNTELQKQVVQHLTSAIEARPFELTPHTLFRVLSLIHLFDKSIFLPRLEDRALELLDQMSIEQLVKLLDFCCKNNQRPCSLLNGIAYYMTRQTEPFTPNNCFTVLFSLLKLSFPHIQLISKVNDDILPKLNTLDKSKMVTLLSLFGQLRWKSIEILEACFTSLQPHLKELDFDQLCYIISCLGALNYTPECFDEIIEEIHRHSSTIYDEAFGYRWINLIWNLAILQKKDFLPEIYKQGFCEGVLQNSSANEYQQMVCKVKLLNLNALALQENPSGPNLLKYFEPVEIPQSSLDLKLNDSVLNCLYEFIPKSGYLEANIGSTDLGIRIDAEFIVDHECRPVPFSEFGLKAGSISKALKPLHDKYHRIALLTLSFKNYTLTTDELVGKALLIERILKGAGYTVAKVFYKEFDAQSTQSKKIEYLQGVIKRACQEI